jgi:hypothetical protein
MCPATGLIVQGHVEYLGRNPGIQVWIASVMGNCLIVLIESVSGFSSEFPWVTQGRGTGQQKRAKQQITSV